MVGGCTKFGFVGGTPSLPYGQVQNGATNFVRAGSLKKCPKCVDN